MAVAWTAPNEITETVIHSFDGCAKDRLREVMQSLVRHLHAFATEVGLTQKEWEAAIRTLTDAGRITSDQRQEFISDALGHRTPPMAACPHPHDRPGARLPHLDHAHLRPWHDYLDSDAVFAVKASLVREFVRRAADDPHRPDGVRDEWFSVRNDIVLAPTRQ